MATDKIRVGFYMNAELLQEVDAYAKKNGISRSGAISVLCGQMLQGIKATDQLKDLKEMMQEVIEKQGVGVLPSGQPQADKQLK